MRKNNSALFIVDSPFQCLCMIEAINHFGLTNFDIIVAYCNNNSLDKIDRLLSEQGLKYKTIWLSHLFYDTLPLLFQKHKKYNQFFIGNYCSPHSYAISVLWAKYKARIVFLDDGTQALSLFGDNPIKQKSNWRIDAFMLSIGALHTLKRMGKDTFFSIYDISTPKLNVVHNSFSSLTSSSHGLQAGVYIIGTNTSSLHFKDTEYKDLLIKIIEKYPAENVYYCPHRQDSNNPFIFNYCKDFGIEVYNTEVSVEYDFVKKGINPVAVAGFNSNALFTLHQIFPQSECVNIYFELSEPKLNEEYKTIRKMMARMGIKTVDLLSNK